MRIALVGVLSVALFVLASPAHAADLAAGKEKAEICTACHGDAGISKTQDIPSLAGQPDQFTQWPRRLAQERADAADRRAAQQ
jgi:cytochrome c553